MSAPRIVLASTSPRRAALLAAVGVAFEIVDPGVDESALGAGIASPSRRAVVLAQAKARAASARSPGRIVLAADTLVVLDDEALGKPRDPDEALWMLSRLSGAAHEVVTGVAAVGALGQEATAFETTLVEFAPWPAAALWAASRSAEVLDRAGAYAIQEVAGAHVVRVVGSYPNVVGLPYGAVARVLAGVDAPAAPW